MGRIVVEVMPKPEILDPQGKAVVGSLLRTVHRGASRAPLRTNRRRRSNRS